MLLLVLGITVFYLRPMSIFDSITRLKLLVNGAHSKFANLNGNRIHYYVAGSGEPLVLVHGLASRGDDWSALISQFTRAGYRVYAIDLLGYGQSDRPATSTYSIAEQATVVQAFLDSQHLDHASLAGWSMGGWVAMRVAANQPQRIDRLMLYDAAGYRFVPTFDAAIFSPKTPRELNTLYAQLMPHPPRMPDFIARDILRRMQGRGWVVQRSVASMETAVDVMDGKLSALHMPVLIVFGSDDSLIPPAVGRTMHTEIPQSVLELYDGCGHLAPSLCSDRVGPRSIEFLKAQPPMAAGIIEIPAKK